MERPNTIEKNDWNLLKNKYPKNIQKIVKKINQGYPIQYLIGNVDFFGCEIIVDKNVLIPRFETELFVDLIIKKINILYDKKDVSIIDCGTGSGCIAIKLKKTFPNSKVIGIDKSKKALNIAKINASNNETSIEFKKNKFTDINEKGIDIIVSNPPYIGFFDEIEEKVKKHEPKKALYAFKEGTIYYDQILKKSTEILNKDFLICFEIGQNQSETIKKLVMKYYPESNLEIYKDYNDKDRYAFITNG